jgi:hypothetical protein
VLPRLVKRTGAKLDDHLLQAYGPGMRWLVVMLTLKLATRQLSFPSPELKTILSERSALAKPAGTALAETGT